MKILTRTFKKFVLRKQLRKCRLEEIEMDRKSNMLQDQIIEEIVKGNDERKLDKLQIEKEEVYDRMIYLINERYRLQREIARA